MSNETVREDFETWASDRLGLTTRKLSSGLYQSFGMHTAWEAWQASRAAIEVELPSRLTQDGRSICIDKDGEFLEYCDVVGAIKSLGLKVKP